MVWFVDLLTRGLSVEVWDDSDVRYSDVQNHWNTAEIHLGTV